MAGGDAAQDFLHQGEAGGDGGRDGGGHQAAFPLLERLRSMKLRSMA